MTKREGKKVVRISVLCLIMIIECIVSKKNGYSYMMSNVMAESLEITINSENFPDDNFRAYVKEYDKDNSNGLSEEELAAVTDMDISDKEISNIDGIQYFTNLEFLSCYENTIKELDFRNNKKLKKLWCHTLSLEKLDVSMNTDLELLDCGYNKLTQLDISNNVKLKELRCGKNDIEILNLINNIALEYVDCSYNSITTLDISKCVVLDELHCFDNELTGITFGELISTEKLYCWNNCFERLQVDMSYDSYEDHIYPSVPDENAEYDRKNPYDSYTAWCGTVKYDESTKSILYINDQCNGYKYRFVDAGKIMITGYTGEDKIITIPAKLNDYLVTGVGHDDNGDVSWNVEEITIPEGVTEIGERAFYECGQLKGITLPESLTTIGEYAFYKCTGITTIDIPANVDTLGGGAFEYCENLTEVNISDESKLTELTWDVFSRCYKLNKINIPKKVGFIHNSCFIYSSNLLQIDIDSDNDYFCFSNGFICNKEMTEVISCVNIGESMIANIPDGIKRLKEKSFYGTDAKVIMIPSSVEVIEQDAIFDAWNLNAYIVDAQNENYYSEDGVLYKIDSTNDNKLNLINYPKAKVKEEYEAPEALVKVCRGAFSRPKADKIVFNSGLEYVEPNALVLNGDVKEVVINSKKAKFDDSALIIEDNADIFFRIYAGTTVEEYFIAREIDYELIKEMQDISEYDGDSAFELTGNALDLSGYKMFKNKGSEFESIIEYETDFICDAYAIKTDNMQENTEYITGIPVEEGEYILRLKALGDKLTGVKYKVISIVDKRNGQEEPKTGEGQEEGTTTGEQTEEGPKSGEETQEGQTAGEQTQEETKTGEGTEEGTKSGEETQEGQTTGEQTQEETKTGEGTEEGTKSGEEAQEEQTIGEQTQEEPKTGEGTQEGSKSGEETQEEPKTGEGAQEGQATGEQTKEETKTGEGTEEGTKSGEEAQEGKAIGEQSKEEPKSGEETQEEQKTEEQTEEEPKTGEGTEEGPKSGEEAQEEQTIGEQTEEEPKTGEGTQEGQATGEQTKEEQKTGEGAQEEQTIGEQTKKEPKSGGETQIIQPQMFIKQETIIVADNCRKVLGDKTFYIGAESNSDTKLMYSSNNRKIATISSKGKIKLRGCGKVKITIIAPETVKYAKAEKTVTLIVTPSKVKLKKCYSPKRATLYFKWSKISGVTGYQYQLSYNKNKFNGYFITKKNKVHGTMKSASGRKMYIRIRAYVKIAGKKYYGKWSKTHSMMVK